MRFHLIGSLRNFQDDIHTLRAIANILHKNGHFVEHYWFEGVYDRKSRATTKESSLDWPEIVETNLRACIESDALIIEGSRFNYSQGYQTALALEYGKPVLNLYREDLPEYKEWPDKLFVSGISNPLFTSKPYKNEADLERIVTQFIADHSKKTRELDVQLVLDGNSFEKLDRLSRSEGKSKTALIKEILTRNLD
ncbi:MAG TPA: hypothetical protein VFS14_00275 [Candidatus Saccharimonadales bacterium]|nr:hypothetical protein [Candidatus Saccharimonadales bacterium]